MDISISNLTMTYPTGKAALRGVDLTLASPALIGLLGPNGAGKSTLMKLLTAGLWPTAGSILLDGQPLAKQEQRLKACLGYLPQSFGLYDELTVWQFLDYMAALKGCRDSRVEVESALRAADLYGKRKSPIRALSGGQRQRVGIAQALLGSPELLILDEPTVGLDPEERLIFRDLFSRLAQDRLVLLSTHIIEDVQSVCNALVVLHEGRVRFAGEPDRLVAMAEGHVGVFRETDPAQEQGLRITSRVNTAGGVVCRAIAQTLPTFASPVEPTLEDAYIFLLAKEAVQ